MSNRHPLCITLCLLTVLTACHATRIGVDSSVPPRLWFNRVCTHWHRVDETFLDYTERVRPQIIITGFFGPGYHSAAAYAREKGVDAYWSSLGGGPVDQQWWRGFIDRAHRQGAKVMA